MFILGLFLKILYKFKLGSILYPIFLHITQVFKFVRLPKLKQAKGIIKKASNYKKYRKFYDIDKNNSKCKRKYNIQIIVPVYNSERYIKRCLNSLLSQQTKYSYQIIVVNDGSTDNTSVMLDKYKYNPLVKVINQKNLGRSYARNTGLVYASSKYIMFVDSDDILTPNALEDLLSIALKKDSDIVFGGYYMFHNNGHISQKVSYNTNYNLCMNSSNDINDFVWGKIFKLSLFKNIKFPVGYEFEDTVLAFWIYPKCHRISSINSIVYLYRYNPQGITHSFQFTNISVDSFLITNVILKRLSKYNIKRDEYIYNTFLKQVKTNCMRNIFISTKIQKSIFVITCNLFSKYFKNFSTNISYYEPLENSLKYKNYMDYILFCIMK